MYGAVAAARTGKRVALYMMYAPADEKDLELAKTIGIDIYPIVADVTTYVQVIHESKNMDERRIVTKHFSGQFNESMIPGLNSRFVHLAGCNDHDFPVEFVQAMHKRGYSLSTDMQSFIRNNDPEKGILFSGLKVSGCRNQNHNMTSNPKAKLK